MTQTGHDMHAATPSPIEDLPPSYFNHSEYAAWLYAHITLMIIAWTILLPIAVFTSTAKSRLALPTQISFLAVNALGVFTSIIYDAKTPDLYPNNAHHHIGWAVSWIAAAWILLGIFTRVAGRSKTHKISLTDSGSIVSQAIIRLAQPNEVNSVHTAQRLSNELEGGTERESSFSGPTRTNSVDQVHPGKLEDSDHENHEDGDCDHEENPFLGREAVSRFVTKRVPRIKSTSSEKLRRAANITYVVLERFQVFLSFLALTTGFVTWVGIFRGNGLLNGLAHWIKGGIFFWYGLLTLGRWMGAFADFGWAWNVKPEYPRVSKAASRMPSAEFTESFVIFLYGASNVFLEHLTAWGKEWSMMDLEHVAITIMFFGGGLLGMLVESQSIRHLLNTSVDSQIHNAGESMKWRHIGEAQDHSSTPKTYRTSLNPLPALVIFLLGLLMSAHHQDSATSAAVHGQWGTLFSGFAIARIFTYLLMYLRPPVSHYPSRPPTELISVFCLVCGGLVFMASTRDVIKLLERNGLHAMFVLTVMIGLSCLIMVWTVVLYAIRGWAMRRETRG